MKPDPIKIGLIFLGASCTGFVFGATIIYLAWKGFQSASYPLTKTYQLEGNLARGAAVLIGLFGLFVFCCGVATLWFGIWRVGQLI